MVAKAAEISLVVAEPYDQHTTKEDWTDEPEISWMLLVWGTTQ